LGEDLGGVVPGVGRDGLALGGVGRAEHDDVRGPAEGVGVDGAGLDDDLRVLPRGLAGGGAVKVPVPAVRHGHALLSGDDLGFAAALLGGVQPDVLHEGVVGVPLVAVVDILRESMVVCVGFSYQVPSRKERVALHLSTKQHGLGWAWEREERGGSREREREVKTRTPT
jgi:hypothetical protein